MKSFRGVFIAMSSIVLFAVFPSAVLDSAPVAASEGEAGEPMARMPLVHTPAELFFHRQSRETEALIDRPNTYDFEPSPIRNVDGSLDVWYCGGDLEGPEGNHDENYLVRFDAQGVQQGPIQSVVQPSFLQGVADGRNACHPSVIRHGFPGIKYPGGTLGAGDELYYMYYECGAFAVDNQTGLPARPPVQICLAASLDGVTWMKYRSDLIQTQGTHFGSETTIPTPVVVMNPLVADGCNFEELGGVYYIDWDLDPDPNVDLGCSQFLLYYGSGHPTAISIPNQSGSGRKVWLFYYDSGGAPNEKGIRLVRSDDGFHFYPVQDLFAVDEDDNQLFHPDGKPVRLERGIIKYYDGEFVDRKGNAQQGAFIATGAAFGSQYFAYSFDGIKWIVPWPPFRANQNLRLAGVHADDQDPTRSLCPTEGPPSPVGDAYGYLDSLTDVEILVGEGLRRNVRHDEPPFPFLPIAGVPHPCRFDGDEADQVRTWGMYRLSGDFGHDSSASTLTGLGYCAIYEGQNVRQTGKRTDPSGTVIDGTTYKVEGGQYKRYTDEAHFLALNGGDPHAYLAVSDGTLSRIELECTDGGTLPPATDICDDYDGTNVRKDYAPNEGSIIWVEGGQRYSYAGGWGSPMNWQNEPLSFLYLNYGDDSAWQDSGGPAVWDALIASCPYAGSRQPTVCHEYNDRDVSPNDGALVEFVKWGNRYGYLGWCGCTPVDTCPCDLHSFVEVNGPGLGPTVLQLDPTELAEIAATCPYVGLKGELDP